MSVERRPAHEEPEAYRLDLGDLELVAWEWPGEGDPILLVHATGFHARCWDAVVKRLPGRRVFALDQASHGASSRKPPPYDPSDFGMELAAACRSLGLAGVRAAGHSMGGHALVVAAAREPALFSSLLLLDPVIIDRAFAVAPFASLSAAEHPVGRRRNHWDSPEQMREAFSRKEPYSRWDQEVLGDYCRHGLRATGQGGFELACPPHLEVEVYLGMHMRTIYDDIPAVKVPVDIVRARDRRPGEHLLDFSPSPTWAGLAGCFSDARDEQLPADTHFFPMEKPDWMADRIARFADAARA